ncbi:MAG: hypothetical protein R8K22_04275 [Mariprofundaceae bacterium]
MIVLLLMLNACEGAFVSIPIGPVTIGADISRYGESTDTGFEMAISKNDSYQLERE